MCIFFLWERKEKYGLYGENNNLCVIFGMSKIQKDKDSFVGRKEINGLNIEVNNFYMIFGKSKIQKDTDSLIGKFVFYQRRQ